MKNKVIFLSVFLLVLVFNVSAAEDDTPDKTMTKLIELFKSYHKAAKDQTLTSAQKEENKIIGAQIENIFDYDALLKGALKDQWKAMSAAQRNAAFAKFKRLVELIAYPQGSYFYNNAETKFEKAVLDGDVAVIKSNNYNIDKDLEISIDYVYRKVNGKWFLIDLAMNEHSLVEAYKLQINRIVKKDGVAGLISKLDEELKKFD